MTRQPADICLVLEGSYPFVLGGVSSWVQSLMQMQEHLAFRALSIVPADTDPTWKYTPPSSFMGLETLVIGQEVGHGRASEDQELAERLADALISVSSDGGLRALAELIDILDGPAAGASLGDLVNSPLAFQIVRLMYRRTLPGSSFLQYFWAWRVLFGGLLAVLRGPLPEGRLYHTVSTGFAGLVAARAALVRRVPVILTEHGIYTNERRIEIAMADWIADRLDLGFSISAAAFDIRDLWMRVFEAYSRICYEASSTIVALNAAAQREQLALGAPAARTRIISNGIDLDRFARTQAKPVEGPPTIAFIGRVVPIKDVRTFIHSVALLVGQFEGLRALVLGPSDEDPDYLEACESLVAELGLSATLSFEGSVAVQSYLEKIDVLVLTSISEAQPLVILEAGAAGVPCVATDTGSCREMILGEAGEEPAFGPGGAVTGLVAPAETAAAVSAILQRPDRGRELGENLRRRVGALYGADKFAAAYADLYSQHLSPVTEDRQWPA